MYVYIFKYNKHTQNIWKCLFVWPLNQWVTRGREREREYKPKSMNDNCLLRHVLGGCISVSPTNKQTQPTYIHMYFVGVFVAVAIFVYFIFDFMVFYLFTKTGRAFVECEHIFDWNTKANMYKMIEISQTESWSITYTTNVWCRYIWKIKIYTYTHIYMTVSKCRSFCVHVYILRACVYVNLLICRDAGKLKCLQYDWKVSCELFLSCVGFMWMYWRGSE